MSENTWPTAITDIGKNKINIRGYPVQDLMGNASFAQVAYLAIFGELPDEKTGKIIDAIIVSSVDHGVTPPSILSSLVVFLPNDQAIFHMDDPGCPGSDFRVMGHNNEGLLVSAV